MGEYRLLLFVGDVPNINNKNYGCLKFFMIQDRMGFEIY